MKDVTLSIATTGKRQSILNTLTSIMCQENISSLLKRLQIVTFKDSTKYIESETAKHIFSILDTFDVDVSVIYQKSRGIGKARALQLGTCETKHLLFVDDDVVLMPYILRRLYYNFSFQRESAVAVMPKMLTNYDPSGDMAESFIDMTPVDYSDISKVLSKDRIMLPFYNIISYSNSIKYDYLLAITCMLDISKFDTTYPISVLKRWHPKHGYEDRWLGKYLISKGLEIYLSPRDTVYHFMEASETRYWETDLDLEKESKLLDTLLDNPLLED